MKNTPFLDDMARLASGATGSLLELKREIEALATGKLEEAAARMNLVSREEFDTLRLQLSKALEENDILKSRLAELEARLPPRRGESNL